MAPDPAQWAAERQLVERLLTTLEASERAELTALGCPTNPVELYAILAGERPAPWPARQDGRNRERVRHALHALVQVQQARTHLGPTRENARLAVYHALLAVTSAGSVALAAILGTDLRERNLDAARRRGADIRAAVAARDVHIQRLAATYRQQYPHASQRQVAGHVGERLKVPSETVRARLRELARAVKKVV